MRDFRIDSMHDRLADEKLFARSPRCDTFISVVILCMFVFDHKLAHSIQMIFTNNFSFKSCESRTKARTVSSLAIFVRHHIIVHDACALAMTGDW